MYAGLLNAIKELKNVASIKCQLMDQLVRNRINIINIMVQLTFSVKGNVDLSLIDVTRSRPSG